MMSISRLSNTLNVLETARHGDLKMARNVTTMRDNGEAGVLGGGGGGGEKAKG
jgi:hypothetical protein